MTRRGGGPPVAVRVADTVRLRTTRTGLPLIIGRGRTGEREGSSPSPTTPRPLSPYAPEPVRPYALRSQAPRDLQAGHRPAFGPGHPGRLEFLLEGWKIDVHKLR